MLIYSNWLKRKFKARKWWPLLLTDFYKTDCKLTNYSCSVKNYLYVLYFSESTLSEPEPLRKADKILTLNKNNTTVDEDVILKDTGKHPIIEVLSSTDNDVNHSEEEDFLSPDTDSESDSDYLTDEKVKCNTIPIENTVNDMEIKSAIENLSSGLTEMINDLPSFDEIQIDSDHSNESCDLDNTLTEENIDNILRVKEIFGEACDISSEEKAVDEESIVKKIEALNYETPVNAAAIILDAESKRIQSKSLLFAGNTEQYSSACENKTLSIIDETLEASIPDSCKDTDTEDSFCCYPAEISSETTQRINQRLDNTFLYSKSKTQETVKFQNSVPDELKIVNIDIKPGMLNKNIIISCLPNFHIQTGSQNNDKTLKFS